MLDVALLNTNLKLCEDIYRSQKDADKKQLMLKLALLEACGWLEECLDSLYAEVIIDQDKFKQEAIQRIQCIYAFDAKAIKEALIILIGIVNYSQLEKSLNQETWEKAKSSLGTLKKARDSSAHTIYAGNQDYMGISSINNNIQNVIKSLKEIEDYLKQHGFIRFSKISIIKKIENILKK